MEEKMIRNSAGNKHKLLQAGIRCRLLEMLIRTEIDIEFLDDYLTGETRGSLTTLYVGKLRSTMEMIEITAKEAKEMLTDVRLDSE